MPSREREHEFDAVSRQRMPDQVAAVTHRALNGWTRGFAFTILKVLSSEIERCYSNARAEHTLHRILYKKN